MKVLPLFFPPKGETLNTNTLPFNKEVFSLGLNLVKKNPQNKKRWIRPRQIHLFYKYVYYTTLLYYCFTNCTLAINFTLSLTTILPASVTAFQVKLKSFLLIVVSISKPAFV